MSLTPRFKVDLRWPNETGAGPATSSGRLSDRTATDDADMAISAFRKLLAKDELAGQAVAARFVVGGKSLYFSEFDRPFGEGRIHPGAPLDAEASPNQARAVAAWTP